MTLICLIVLKSLLLEGNLFMGFYDFIEAMTIYVPVQDKNTPLNVFPHYSDKRFKTAQDIFGKETSDLNYEYSDRLVQRDYDLSRLAMEIADNSKHPKYSANYYEVYLTEYFGEPVEVKNIKAGVNLSNGYPYLVFGFKLKDKKDV